MAGKWHLGRPGPVARGFDAYYGMLGGFGSFWDPSGFTRLPPGRPARTYPEGRFYATEAITDFALDFLAVARRAGDRPCFLYLAYTAPHFPLHAPKEDIDRYVATYRLLPTLREVASAPNPEHQGDQRTPPEGISLVPAFDDQPITRDALSWEHEGNRAVRAGRWKLVARRGQPWELYDLEADRVERHDLADHEPEPERVRELAVRWEAWSRRAHVVPSPFLDMGPK